MPEFLTDFFVLSKSGKVVFNKCNSLKVNEQLIGGFFSAFISYHETVFDKKLKSIELDNYNIYFCQKIDFIFIGFSDKDIKPKAAQGNLDCLAERFMDRFESLPDHWDTKVSIFQNFHEEVEKTRKDRALDHLMERFHEM